MQDSRRKIVVAAVAVYTILQLLVLYYFGYTPYPDSIGYTLLAEQSINNGELYPVSSLLNDYPFLWNIGAINAVILSLSLFHSITPLLIVYSLMKGASAWLFYEITDKVCGPRISLVALTLYMIYPANYGEGTSALSELPFMFFTLTALYLGIVRKQYFVAGVVLAIANWFRPMAIVFLVAMIIWLMMKWKKSLSMVVGYAVMILIIGGVTMKSKGLFLYQAKTGWMALTDYSTHECPESQNVREHSEWNVSQKDSAWRSMFFDWLKDHPTEYVAQMPRKLLDTYVSDNVNICTFIPDKQTTGYMYEEVSLPILISHFPKFSGVQWLACANLVLYYLLLLTALLSLLYYRSNTHLLPLCVIVIGTLILLFAGHGEARFHNPLMPFFIMLSAITINHKYGKNKMG